MARIKDSKGKTTDFTMEKEYRVDGEHWQTKERVTFIKLKVGTKLGKDDSDIETYTNETTGCVTTGVWVKGYYDKGGHDGDGNYIIPTDFFLKNVAGSGTVCNGTNSDGIPAGGKGTSTKTPSSIIDSLFKLDDSGTKKGGTTIDLSPTSAAEAKRILEEEEAKKKAEDKDEKEAGMGFWGWTAVLAGAGLMYKYVLTK